MPTYKPVDPNKRLRKLRKDFKDLQRDRFGAGKERLERLAEFVREAHDERLINMVLHAAPILLDEDPKSPKRLVDAYLGSDDIESVLEGVKELESLAGWIGREDISTLARETATELAPKWVAEADPGERRRRLRDLGSWFGRAFADDVRDQVGDV